MSYLKSKICLSLQLGLKQIIRVGQAKVSYPFDIYNGLRFGRRISGVSVIEILIVMTIISVFLIGGTLSYGSFRRYNLASESLRFIKEMVRIAKYQTYTVRADTGEAVIGTGINISQLGNGAWRFKMVKIAVPVAVPGQYVEFPAGNIPLTYVQDTVFEDIETLTTLPEFGLRLHLNGNPVSCTDFYIIFEVPLGAVRYYCTVGANLAPLPGGDLTIGFLPLSNKFLYITKWSEIYMR